MKRPRMRPRFEVELSPAQREVLGIMRTRLGEGECPCRGVILEDQAEIRVRLEDEHFWSPVLSLRRRNEDGRQLLRGRFGPHPHVWTGFMAVYGVLGMIAIAGLMYGISQWMLGWTPWALGIAPLAVVIGGFVFGAAFIGQGLGSEQMYVLRAFVDRSLEAAEDPTASVPCPPPSARGGVG